MTESALAAARREAVTNAKKRLRRFKSEAAQLRLRLCVVEEEMRIMETQIAQWSEPAGPS